LLSILVVLRHGADREATPCATDDGVIPHRSLYTGLGVWDDPEM